MAWLKLAAAVAVTSLMASVIGASPAFGDVATAPAGSGRGAAATLAAGNQHTCALLSTDTVKCWGRNDSGQLGYGDTNNRGDNAGEMSDLLPVVDLGTGITASAVAAGDFHSCALLDTAEVKCWGDNRSGQLGYGDTNNRGDNPAEMGNALPTVDLGTGRTVVAIAPGDFHTCALLDNGSIKCWGKNLDGQLGYGDTNNRGDNAGEMGNALPTIDLGTGRTATAISAGDGHTCALLDNGTLKCWGESKLGQTGHGSKLSLGDNPSEMGNALPAVDLGTGRTATAMTAGDFHSCAILDNGTLKCWGKNIYGQLGYGDTNNRGDNAGEMGNALPTIDLGTGRTAVAVTAGFGQTCAVLDDATLKCWGRNSTGQLGYGDTIDRGDNPGEMGNALPTIDLGVGRTAVTVTTRHSHICVLLDNSDVKCWGDNSFGQLGVGNTSPLGDAAGEMGANLAPVVLSTTQTITIPPSPPSQPDPPTASAGNTTSRVYWVAPGDGGSPISGYIVESSTDGMAWTTSATLTTPTTQVILTGLTNRMRYRFRVSAVNSVGTSPPSLASALTAVVAPSIPCPTDPHGFTDVPATSFAVADITCIKGLGITTGTSPTTYDPAGNVTREQMAAFLARLWRKDHALWIS